MGQIWCIKIVSQQVLAKALLKMRKLMRVRKVEIANQYVAQLVKSFMVTMANKRGHTFEARLRNEIR